MPVRPDPQSLRAFVAVAREGNVSRAAQRLHLSQPAVSLQIKALSAQTGLALFERSPRGLTLTRDGAALLPQAERVLAALGEFMHAAQALQSTLRGTLRIGTILDPEFTRLGAFLRALVESAPQIETELRQGMSGEVFQQLERGELDVGFYLGVPGGPYVTRELSRFQYRVLAPPGWGPQVTGRDWAALAALPWIGTPPASAHHRLLAEVYGPLGVQPRRVALVDQEASMLDLVRSGVGLSLARDSIAMREAQARGLVVADRVHLDAVLSFVAPRARAAEAVIGSALAALDAAWPGTSSPAKA